MKLTGAQILVETIIEQGVDTVFGYPGGTVLNIYDELYKNQHRLHHIITAHEQGAAHAADGYARVSGKVGVVIATSGPGATNLITGIANAYLDSVPMVAITGNVSCDLIGRDSFQEVDIMGMTLPVTKHNYIVKDTAKLADVVREAFAIAKSGRPGPVLIDIPKDVQIKTAEFTPASAPAPMFPFPEFDEEEIEAAAKMIAEAKKPYIYCGGGVISCEASKEVLELAELIDAPIGCSMMGLHAVPATNARVLGMNGMHGRFPSTKAKNESDLIIAVGVRFSDRATGNKAKYATGAKILHIDVDAAELDKNISTHLGICANVKDVLTALLPKLEKQTHPEWQARIDELKTYEKENSAKCIGALSPHFAIEEVSRRMSADTPIATDVGQHQMWVAQKYSFRSPRTLVTSGGLGTMGFGLGAAIGSAVASGKRTVLFTGDGCFGMNLNELTTAVSQDLPIIIIIMNNGVLGMVRQWQGMFYEKHYSETTLNRKTDFVKLAEAFGAVGYRATSNDEFVECLDKALASNGPVVIDCMIDMDEKVFPMIPPNGSVEQLIIK